MIKGLYRIQYSTESMTWYDVTMPQWVKCNSQQLADNTLLCNNACFYQISSTLRGMYHNHHMHFFILQSSNVRWYHLSPCGPDINHEQIYNVLRYGTMVKQYSEWFDT